MRPPEPLGPQHQLEGFDCGNAALNRWLQQRALANERQGVSRTVVLCPGEGNDVIAYACLSAGAIVLAEVPGALRRNMPDPLPVVVLGRLAVDRRQSLAGAGDRRGGCCVLPLAWMSPLVDQRFDVETAALITSRLTEAPKPPSPIPWFTPTSKRHPDSFLADAAFSRPGLEAGDRI